MLIAERPGVLTMAKGKMLGLKKSLKPVSEETLEQHGGGRIIIFGCCTYALNQPWNLHTLGAGCDTLPCNHGIT